MYYSNKKLLIWYWVLYLFKMVRILFTLGLSIMLKKSIFSCCKNKFYSTNFLFLFISLFLIFLNSDLSAAPTLTESTVNAGTSGATLGSFDGGGTALRVIGDLSNTSAADRNFLSQTFTPSVTGTYVFGLSRSTRDTVLILYENGFDPSNPSANALIVNDDSDGLGAGGVVMGRCGPFARFCPKITTNLEGGKTFQIVITSFAPSQVVSDGAGFYIFGEPVLVGSIENIAEDPIVIEAAEEITQAVDLDLQNIIQNFMKNERDQIDSAVQRHIARTDPEETSKSNFKQPIFSDDNSNKIQTVFKQPVDSNNKTKKTDTIFKQPVVSAAHPKTIFFYDSSILEFASNTNKKETISLNTDLIMSQNLYYFKNKNGNLSKNANINIALEKLLTKRSTLGASIGFQYNKHFQRFPDRADNSQTSMSLGLYGLTSASQNLILAWHYTYLFGKGEVTSEASTLQWKSNYDTEGFTSGISTTGKIPAKFITGLGKTENIEIWPKINLSYGEVKSTNLHSRITLGAISESIIVSSAPVKVIEASISPDFKIRIGKGEPLLLGEILTISPGARCQIIDASSTSHVCGSLLGIYFSGKNDGMKRAEIQLEKSSIGKGASFWVGLRLPL